jgi:hypothetical protein
VCEWRPRERTDTRDAAVTSTGTSTTTTIELFDAIISTISTISNATTSIYGRITNG